MKKHFLLFSLVCILFSSCKSIETTTYYLIRHAEKDRTDATNKNPNLNKQGLKRADNWATYFKEIPLAVIYSTDYKRTQQTAKPTAESKKLPIKTYNPNKMYDIVFQEETKGKSILIVGHSNTTPAFVNKILGYEKHPAINDNNNASLFIVTLKKNIKTSVLKEIELLK